MIELTVDLSKEPNLRNPLMMQEKNDWTADAQADIPAIKIVFQETDL